MLVVAASVAELNALDDLPGYTQPASLEAALAASQPVAAFLIASANEPGDRDASGFKVLTGVRKKDQSYPWAISVATTELSHADSTKIVEASADTVLVDGSLIQIEKVAADEQRELSTHRQVIKTYRARPQSLTLAPTTGESKLVSVTRDLLVRKFELEEHAAELRLSGAIGTVSLHHVAVGFVGAEGEKIEYNTNFCAAVNVPRELIHGESSGYYSNTWVSPEDFLAGYENNDPELINPGLDKASLAFVCRRGQCLRSAADAFVDMNLLREHLGLAH